MSNAIFRHLSENSTGNFDLLKRFETVGLSFYDTLSATLMNHKTFTFIILFLLVPVFIRFIRKKDKDLPALISFVFIAVPFLGYLILPVNVNPWHWGGEMGVSLILLAYLIKKLKITGILISAAVIYFGTSNVIHFFRNDFAKTHLDPSLYKNEISAIDYVYTYLPSVYDYPYQYLFWWYGQKKY